MVWQFLLGLATFLMITSSKVVVNAQRNVTATTTTMTSSSKVTANSHDVSNNTNLRPKPESNGLNWKTVISQAIFFLKHRNDLHFSSICIVMDEAACNIGTLCADIMKSLFSKENHIQFSVILTTHSNLSTALDESLKDSTTSLIILDQIFSTNAGQELFSFISDD